MDCQAWESQGNLVESIRNNRGGWAIQEEENFGSDLLSHTATRAVPSALKDFTSVFGMGTGVAPSLELPKIQQNDPSGRTTCNDMMRQAGVAIKVKPHDQLVLLDFTRYRASICSLSTSSSSTGLWGTSPGSANLEVGFPLRCIQRLSNPYIATQRCSWRHNWNTRGTSIPVLSY